MGKYVLKRVLMGLVTVLVVFTINYMVIRLAPGDPVTTLMGKESNDPVLRAALEEKYGLDKPVPVQYALYIKNAVTGDFGRSIIYNRPVIEMILEKITATLLLVVTAAVMALVIGTVIGIQAARYEGSLLDLCFSGAAYVFNAMPAFWLGLMLILILASRLGILPTYGMSDPRAAHTGIAYALDVLKHMVIPVLTLFLIQFPAYFRIAKSSILQVANEDYIVTLRATGMSERKIFNKYILRNAILPTITIFGISMAYLVTGVALIEIVFAWPGTGRLMLTAINQRDYPTLMGIYLIMSISIAVVMVLVDIVYAVFDPRIRY